MNKRPVNLDLRKIKFPITAISSILHRVSGVFLFFFIPVFLWGLQKSLISRDDFTAVSQFFNNPILKFIVWGFLSMLMYHLFAGIRHIVMDLGIGEHWHTARRSSAFVIVLGVISAVLLGIWLW